MMSKRVPPHLKQEVQSELALNDNRDYYLGYISGVQCANSMGSQTGVLVYLSIVDHMLKNNMFTEDDLKLTDSEKAAFTKYTESFDDVLTSINNRDVGTAAVGIEKVSGLVEELFKA